MMPRKEWTKTCHNARLDIGLLQAFYVSHTFPRHSHDYYVICLIRRGLQSFTHEGKKHYTPPGGVILINPGAVHTGEAADESGFEMLCLYPTTSHMQTTVLGLACSHQLPPYFRDVRVDQQWAAESIRALHTSLTQETGALELESCFTWTMAQLIKRYADLPFNEQRAGNKRKAI
jgi:hypothetical protein